MFQRQSFLLATSVYQLFESVHELSDLMIVLIAWNQKGGRCAIKDCIACLKSCLIRLVVLLQRSNETSLSYQASDYLKVIKDERSRIIFQSLVYFVITLNCNRILKLLSNQSWLAWKCSYIGQQHPLEKPRKWNRIQYFNPVASFSHYCPHSSRVVAWHNAVIENLIICVCWCASKLSRRCRMIDEIVNVLR